MGNVQTVFERYEIKYKITAEQKKSILAAIAPYMQLDKYGRTTIRNIYFDTENFRLVRRSIEKPVYKEKLRLRCYEQVTAEKKVFLELKKKYKSVVYKRRLTLTEGEAMQAFRQGEVLPVHSQIGEEIEYVRQYYRDLKPRVFLSYEREAYYAVDKSDFRMTFDENILYRQEDLSLTIPPYGNPLLAAGEALMEIKTSGAIPLWLTKVLTELKIYKTSFSKYGMAYQQIMTKSQEGEEKYARVI